MGLVQLSIVVYTGKAGNLCVDMHDNIAKYMGVPAMPFEVMYKDKATEMKRLVFDYIKTLRRQHLGDISEAPAEIDGFQKDTLKIHESGFPLAPQPTSWKKITRGDLEVIYRLYVTRHYREFIVIIFIRYKSLLERPCMSGRR